MTRFLAVEPVSTRLLGMVCEQLDVNAKETPGLHLKVDSHRKEYIAFLQEHNYPELIANMLMYCELTDNLKDARKPFISVRILNI